MTSSGAFWLEPAFLAWRKHTVWSVTMASGLTVWRCCHGTPGAVPLGTSQWSTLRGTPDHSGECQSAAECHHQYQCRWDFFSLGPMSVSTQEFWHKSEGVWPRQQLIHKKPRSCSSVCQSLSNTLTQLVWLTHSQSLSLHRDYFRQNLCSLI